MKTFNKIMMSLGVVATAFGFSSCVNDLNLEPNNPATVTNVTGDMDRVFADIYLNFSTFGAGGNSPVQGFDGGMSSFQRALFIAEEIPTDEACWLWDPASYGTINYGKVTTTLDCAYGFYSRLIINISLCNDFISQVNNGYYKLDDAGKARAAEYVRQARILRAGCYFYMLSFYDKIPYADENLVYGEVAPQLSRADVYENVTRELEDVVASYNGDNSNTHYGFVGLDAAESILAKIYLNGEVFAGRADYDKCYTHSKNVIDRLGKGGRYGNGLAYSYQGLFGYNNDQFCIGNAGSDVNEIIWTLAQDRVHLTSWSGATFMIAGWLGNNGVEVTMGLPTMDPTLDNVTFTDEKNNLCCYTYYSNQGDYDAAVEAYNKDDVKDWQKHVSETINNIHYSFDPKAVGYVSQQWYNAGDSWKCMVARKSFVRKFEWNDVAMSQSDDRRVAHWQTSAHGFASDNVSLVGDDWGKNGYLAPKFSNWAYNENGTINYAASPTPEKQVGGDCPVIRLAEVYLMAAEAILQGGGGSQAEALKYVNYIRQRAYADDAHAWTSLSMNDLQDERCRELYHENTRRTDLIRWNLWTNGYTWEWKGGVQSGTNLPEYTKLYPIPSRVMSASNYEQTTGY